MRGTKTAVALKDVSKPPARQILFRVTPPLKDYAGNAHKFVVVSAVQGHGTGPFSEPETYIFPATADGKHTLKEMPGSTKGVFDVEEPLKYLGYEVVDLM